MNEINLDEVIRKARVQIFQDAGGIRLSYHQIGKIIEKTEERIAATVCVTVCKFIERTEDHIRCTHYNCPLWQSIHLKE